MPGSRYVRRLALGAAVAGIVVPALRRRLRLPPAVTSVLAWQAPLATALVLRRSRFRDAAVYAVQMWAYLTHYELPNDDHDALVGRVRVRYPISIDRAIGLGEVPTVRLQRALGRPGEVRRHDTVLSAVHWSWFFAPHTALVYILWRHPERFGRSAAQVAAVFDIGSGVYWFLPTAPPWWAGNTGELPHVRRIMTEAGERAWGRYWTGLYDSLSGNQLAAMPSLHFATSVMAAHVLKDVGPVPGAVGWAYAGALGFALVYLGEHYVADLIGGLALTEGVRRAVPIAAPAGRAVAHFVRNWEP
ncbi:MAG TPA: phosphatase PAP2 family protein [Thermoleophilaceae bacterium]|nr:phosphatase PAP2 family protein [Thermoleophilaceae bacterium]